MVKTVINRQPAGESGNIQEEKEEEDFPKVFIGEVCISRTTQRSHNAWSQIPSK